MALSGTSSSCVTTPASLLTSLCFDFDFRRALGQTGLEEEMEELYVEGLETCGIPIDKRLSMRWRTLTL